MTRTNMQSGSRRRYYANYLAHYTRKNSSVLILGAIFVIGVVLGTVLVRSANSDIIDLLLRLSGDFSERRRLQTFTQNILSGSASGFAIIAVVFIFGFCALAQPICAIIPLLRGMGFGFLTATLYLVHKTSAAGFIAVFMIPSMIISTIALLFCCNEAIHLSKSLWVILLGKDSKPYSIKLYCARFIAAGVLWFVSILIESSLYLILPNAFTLIS